MDLVFIKSFLRFANIGAIATACQYIILIVLVSFFFFDSAIASAIGYIVGAIVGYLGNYFITFKSTASYLRSSVKFILIAIIGLIFTYYSMLLLMNHYEIKYLIAQCITTLVLMFFNFIIHQYWTYN